MSSIDRKIALLLATDIEFPAVAKGRIDARTVSTVAGDLREHFEQLDIYRQSVLPIDDTKTQEAVKRKMRIALELSTKLLETLG